MIIAATFIYGIAVGAVIGAFIMSWRPACG